MTLSIKLTSRRIPPNVTLISRLIESCVFLISSFPPPSIKYFVSAIFPPPHRITRHARQTQFTVVRRDGRFNASFGRRSGGGGHNNSSNNNNNTSLMANGDGGGVGRRRRTGAPLPMKRHPPPGMLGAASGASNRSLPDVGFARAESRAAAAAARNR